MTNERVVEVKKMIKSINKLIAINKSQKKLANKIQRGNLSGQKNDVNCMDNSNKKNDLKDKNDFFSDIEAIEQVPKGEENEPNKKNIRKFKKKLRKQRKILKELEEIVSEGEQPADVGKEESKKRKIDGVKSYIHKVGEIFLKSLPKILNTVLTLVVNYCFKNCRIWTKRGRLYEAAKL